jgi:hypothetical protein
MKLRMAATIFAVLVCVAMHTTNAPAQAGQADGPVTKNGLMKMLLLNDSSQQDLIKLITQNGVNFRPTPTEERDLHEAGGSDDLIVAVRGNFRGVTQDNAQTNQSPSGPAAANDLTTPKSSQTTSDTVAPQKKKGFLDRLNSGMDKVNAKVNKANAEVNKQAQAVQATATQATQTAQSIQTQATQTAQSVKTQASQTAQSLKAAGQSLAPKDPSKVDASAQTTTSNAMPGANQSGNGATLVVANNGNGTQSVNALTPSTSNGNNPASPSVAAPSDLAATSWDLLSMTKQGEPENVNQTTPNVQFCRDGSWAILHSGSSEGGKYQIQGSRVVMKTSDGALYGDYQIKRNGNEMVLDDGTWRLRLRYYSPVKC